MQVTNALSLPICTAEDLIIHKVLARRDKDLADIKGIIRRNIEQLDTEYIRGILKQFEEALDVNFLLNTFEKMSSKSGL